MAEMALALKELNLEELLRIVSDEKKEKEIRCIAFSQALERIQGIQAKTRSDCVTTDDVILLLNCCLDLDIDVTPQEILNLLPGFSFGPVLSKCHMC